MMKPSLLTCFCFMLAAAIVWPTAVLAKPKNEVTVTVHSEPRQTFAGFGTSLTNFDGRFQQLPPEARERLSQMVWRDLNFKILRLWFTPSEYLANPDKPDLTAFKRRYIDSGIVNLATKYGCTTLLLAPDDVPPAFAKPKANRDDQFTEFTDLGVILYAKLLASAIDQLHKETGVQIDATGIINEPNDRPVRFTLAQWPTMIKTLRRELDARGLHSVAIVAPEAASCDDVAYDMVDVIRRDRLAWSSLQGIATHTYNMGATDEMAGKLLTSPKTYWQTESSTPGPEALGDTLNAAMSAARVVSDLNHGVTHWVWFIGYEQDDPRDNGTRLLKYDAAFPGGKIEPFHKYGYLKQLSDAIPVESVAFQCTSDEEKTMTWTYGKKPSLLACAVERPDDTWSISVVNYTSDRFSDPMLSEWDRTQGGEVGRQLSVKIDIEPLRGAARTTFDVRRNGSEAGTAEAVSGVFTVTAEPLDLITLTSRK
jgi:O-glycosyl hydrolase